MGIGAWQSVDFREVRILEILTNDCLGLHGGGHIVVLVLVAFMACQCVKVVFTLVDLVIKQLLIGPGCSV
ncbi:hypothetical protein SDC9_163357 [bioreactor metagenome]|uniref:Uncharacterized protein n=1 Tax=bioreactor metagenome TaxID=1076179 RepID=A0A645FRI3_9ZZZZ